MTRNRSSPMRSSSPSGFSAPKSSRRTVAPITQTRCSRAASPAGRKRPVCRSKIAHAQKVGRRADDRHVAPAVASPRRGPRPRESGASAAHRADAARDRLGVLEREVVRRARDEGRHAGRLGLSRKHDEEVGAEVRELSGHVEPRALAEARQEHDGRDADRHAGQGEPRAQAVAAQGAHGETDEVAARSRGRLRRRRVPGRSPRRRSRHPQAQAMPRAAADRGIVRHDDERQAPRVHPLEEAHDLGAGGRVEVPGRLVGEQHATAPSRRRGRSPRAGARRPRAARRGARRGRRGRRPRAPARRAPHARGARRRRRSSAARRCRRRSGAARGGRTGRRSRSGGAGRA